MLPEQLRTQLDDGKKVPDLGHLEVKSHTGLQ